MTSHKEKEVDVHMISKSTKRPKGSNFAYVALIAHSYQ